KRPTLDDIGRRRRRHHACLTNQGPRSSALRSPFALCLSGLWRIGPVIGVNWNGGAQARFGSVIVGYQSDNWLFERGLISSNDLILECPFINVGLSSSTTAVHTFHRLMSDAPGEARRR